MTLQMLLGGLSRRLPDSDGSPRAQPLCTPGDAILPRRDRLSDLVLHADAMAPTARDLAGVWQDILDGRVTLSGEGACPRGLYVICRVAGGTPGPEVRASRIETAVLVRVLSGEQQKAVAFDLGIACSTTSKWYTAALAKASLNAGPVPMPLVIAAQSWASGVMPSMDARVTTIAFDGHEFLVLSVPAPNLAREQRLTRAEREVASALVVGQSRWEIARRRSTSTQTVACQLRGIFSKLDVGGRCALIRRGVESGWFE